MLSAAPGIAGAVDYSTFLQELRSHACICHPEQGRATLSEAKGSEGASKDPEEASVHHAASGNSHEKTDALLQCAVIAFVLLDG